MRTLKFLALMFIEGALLSHPLGAADPVDFKQSAYTSDVQPVVKRFCVKCHSSELAEAEINLADDKTIDDVRRHPEVWVKVGEMLDSGQMPPKDAPQPSDDERKKLREWVYGYLKAEAKAQAGDPGRVVLRRLNNVEYTNSIRDLTQLKSLTPAKEFPVDSAAGEGFTNLGNSLVMSPALLTKYFDAAKEVAAHAVLLPKGFRFSPNTSARDWTDERLAAIRNLYSRYTDARGGTQVNLQGIVFNTNTDGRLPIDKYLEATIAERDGFLDGSKTFEEVARERGLSPKYLGILWYVLTDDRPSFLLDRLRAKWDDATAADVPALTDEIVRWQKTLWRFTSVGHIGKQGGPKAWMEPISPITSGVEIRHKIADSTDDRPITLYLTAYDAGDGNAEDFVMWRKPRLVGPGRPDLPLRDLQTVANDLTQRRRAILTDTSRYLKAASEAIGDQTKISLEERARRNNLDEKALAAWLNYLGIGTGGAVEITSYFTKKINNASGYNFVSGWGEDATPLIVANSSDMHVRIPGNMKPHGVAVHPSPTLNAAVGWRSPVAATVRVEAKIQHAHPECGNGVTWSLEFRRGPIRQRLASGIAAGANPQLPAPIEKLQVQPGDLVSLLIGPRDGNHSCDLTAVDLNLTSVSDPASTWDLARDVSPDIQTANPHADRLGHEAVWHFYTEPVAGADFGPIVPNDSLLAKWQTETNPIQKQHFADSVQQLLAGPPPSAKDSPDGKLYRQLTSLSGPLFGLPDAIARAAATGPSAEAKPSAAPWGVDPAMFGRHPRGHAIDASTICVKAPALIEITLPADLAVGCEFVTVGTLDPDTGADGSVQLQVLTQKPTLESGLVPSTVTEIDKNSRWTDNNRQILYSTPIIVCDESPAAKRIEAGFETYRNLFPAALCYSKIVPVDEVVTLTLFYREDHHLIQLMLSDSEAEQLNDLWSELHFVSRDALTLVDAYKQLMEYATQDADPKVFEPLRKPIYERARAFLNELQDAEPRQLEQLTGFASKAYRRPLTFDEIAELQDLYVKLREQELPHDEAFRFLMARILIAPAFLYRAEPLTFTGPAVPVNDWAMASRLSYFLWASMPDDELFRLAAWQKLREPDILADEAQRMLKDDRVRMLATEFACQWLHVRDFDTHSEKSEQVFPTFNALRAEMYEETILFFTDLFQRDGSVLEILNADHTFLNESLARHYGIPDVTGPEWRRVDNVRQYGRGGILTFATTLATQSGASRTSPVLRGNWVLESLLGEKLPRPPKNVPPLPEAETDTQKTVRQLVEAHRSIESCANCHERIDSFGFSLESYDAIGRRRDKDLGGRPIDVNVQLKDGTKFTGETGLRDYLLETRREVFLRTFCRKLLGYALARGVQLSDEPLLDEMLNQLKANDYRFSSLIDTIVRSKQFRFQQGLMTD